MRGTRSSQAISRVGSLGFPLVSQTLLGFSAIHDDIKANFHQQGSLLPLSDSSRTSLRHLPVKGMTGPCTAPHKGFSSSGCMGSVTYAAPSKGRKCCAAHMPRNQPTFILYAIYSSHTFPLFTLALNSLPLFTANYLTCSEQIARGEGKAHTAATFVKNMVM